MSLALIQEYQDSPAARAELVDFLNRTGLPHTADCSWEQRLSHWWDENPHAPLHPLRGYEIRSKNRIVAYGGTLPTAHTIGAECLPSMCASTLRAEPGFIQETGRMLMKIRHLGKSVMVSYTTAIPKLQQVLTKMGAHTETRVKRHLFPSGMLAKANGSDRRWPQLDGQLRLTLDLAEVRSIAPKQRSTDRLEKWLSVDSLRWQISTPMYRFHFMGAVDSAGALHAFLIIKHRPRTFRLVQAWEVMEAWTAQDRAEPVLALLGHLVRHPEILGQRLSWLTTTAFPGDALWDEAPSFVTKQEKVCHYFMLPHSLRTVPKHNVMAEGDLIL